MEQETGAFLVESSTVDMTFQTLSTQKYRADESFTKITSPSFSAEHLPSSVYVETIVFIPEFSVTFVESSQAVTHATTAMNAKRDNLCRIMKFVIKTFLFGVRTELFK
jgi:hypothetical protein